MSVCAFRLSKLLTDCYRRLHYCTNPVHLQGASEVASNHGLTLFLVF